MAVSVKYQNVYRILADDSNKIISLPMSIVINLSDMEDFTNVVKIQIFLLQHLLPYPCDDADNTEEAINKFWYISSEEFNILLERMFKPHIEGTKFESVLYNITRLINSCKLTCADYLSDFNKIYSLVFFEYNAKNNEACKILTHLRQILRQEVNNVGFEELQHITMMMQRLVLIMRKPYAIYAAAVTTLFHLPLLMGYPDIRIKCEVSELSHISLIDVIANIILLPIHEALTESRDEFLRIFINRKLGHVHNLDSLHHWYQHLLSMDRNCVKKYILSIDKYMNEKSEKHDDFLIVDGDNVSFNSNGWRILALLTREDRAFALMQKRVLESINIPLTSFISIWFTAYSMLIHYPQCNVSNMSYTVSIKRMIQKLCKMTGYHAKNNRGERLNHLTVYRFINEISNTIINMRLFNYIDVIELFHVYNRHQIVVEIMQFILDACPKAMGKIFDSTASKSSFH